MKVLRLLLTVVLCLTLCVVFAQKPTSSAKKLPEIREIVEKKPAKRPKALVKQEKELVGNFCRIPGVTVTTDTSQEVMSSYYMLECEVMNKSYNRFLEDLKAQSRTADYEVAKIHDESGEPFFYRFDDKTGTVYQQKYAQSPGYGWFPVVNISYEGARLFCQWLTEKLGNGEWEYRLPTEWEWKWAAHDGNMLNTYSLTGPFITNYNGRAPYNYLKVGDENITRTDSGLQVLTFDESVIQHYNFPMMCLSWYSSSNYHLYNMCGNVAEMVAEKGVAFGGSYDDPGYDIRIDSRQTYEGYSPKVGFRVIAVRK